MEENKGEYEKEEGRGRGGGGEEKVGEKGSTGLHQVNPYEKYL